MTRAKPRDKSWFDNINRDVGFKLLKVSMVIL